MKRSTRTLALLLSVEYASSPGVVCVANSGLESARSCWGRWRSGWGSSSGSRRDRALGKRSLIIPKRRWQMVVRWLVRSSSVGFPLDLPALWCLGLSVEAWLGSERPLQAPELYPFPPRGATWRTWDAIGPEWRGDPVASSHRPGSRHKARYPSCRSQADRCGPPSAARDPDD
jgi:hypothetical protein